MTSATDTKAGKVVQLLPELQARKGKTYENYIDGKWQPSVSGKTIANVNPADTNDVIGHWPESTAEDMRHAINAAHKAFATWQHVPAPQRAKYVQRAAAILRKKEEELAQAMTWEEGKWLKEARGEVQRGLGSLEYLAEEGRRMAGETIPSENPNIFAYTVRKPLGVVGLITPWNFPLAIPAWKIAPALVAGNTVVLKPSELTPLSAHLLLEAFVEVGIPPGVVNVVYGMGEVIGAEMVASPLVKAISFTGSTEVGKKIYAEAAKNMTRVQLEMGGKNAAIVLADADQDWAARTIVEGAYGSTGQRCTATSRVLVEKSIAKEFTAKLVAASKQLRVGYAMEEENIMGPLVDGPPAEQALRYIEIGRKEGATVALGGDKPQGEACARGHFVMPTILTGVQPSMTVAQEEIFGPVLSIIEVENFDEAIEVANGVRYGHSSAVYTRDLERVFEYQNRMEAGLLHVNCPTIFSEVHLPFGGIKDTGGPGGREMGKTAIDFFTEWHTMYLNYRSK